jgi:microcystin-dependent protein
MKFIARTLLVFLISMSAFAGQKINLVTQVQGNLPVANGGKIPGEVFTFAGSACPTGSLAIPTTTTAVSRSTYVALYAAIGTTWGAGDGSTTFNLPVLMSGGVPVQASANVGTVTHGKVKDHTHNYTAPAYQPSQGSNATYVGVTTGVTSTPNAPEGGPDNLAAGATMMFCIKY